MTEDDLADIVQRLRFVANNIDSISKRHDCCEQLQVVISRLGGEPSPKVWPDDNTYHFMKE